MIFALGPFALDRDGGFVGLDVGAGEQLPPEQLHHAEKQFAHLEHRTAQGRLADLDLRVALDSDGLPVEWLVVLEFFNLNSEVEDAIPRSPGSRTFKF